MNNWIVFIIEESQNVLGTIGRNDVWSTYISEARNLNMAFIFLARRMAQVSTKAVENCRGYFFGKTSGDNDLKKIRRMTTDVVRDEVPKLGLYDFIYWNGVYAKKVINIPKYEADSHPIRWRGEE